MLLLFCLLFLFLAEHRLGFPLLPAEVLESFGLLGDVRWVHELFGVCVTVT